MADLAEKRVFDDRAGATDLAVAATEGVATVSVSGDRVGEIGLIRRCLPADLAVAPAPAGRLAVATDEDVLGADAFDPDAFEATEFGPACAVTFVDGRPLAGASDGRLGIHADGRWTTVGALPDPPAALDGNLVGFEGGVRRLVDGQLRPAGLTAVIDIAHAAGVPLAATADGLYSLGNGWLDLLPGPFQQVSGAPDGRAHAATPSACYERRATEWRPLELPIDGTVAAVAYGERTYICTGDGQLLVEGGDGWRVHPLGLTGIVAAVAR